LPLAEILRPRSDIPLAPFTTLDIGGSARWLVRADDVEQVLAAHQWAAEHNVDLLVLGGGSNVVVADEGYPGLVVHMRLSGCRMQEISDCTVVDCGAGESWDDVVALAVERGLAGVECLSGIPGSVGGTPIQNVGAYGQEVANIIQTVTAVDRLSCSVVELSARECDFSYRQSRFKQHDLGRFIVCRVTFTLHAGAPTMTYPDVIAYAKRHGWSTPTVAQVRTAILDIRRGKGMVSDAADPDTRSVGSFFMNPVVSVDRYETLEHEARQRVPAFRMDRGEMKIPAAWLIERAGFLKGHISGRVGLSSKHPLAIINRGGATARELISLAAAIKRRVIGRFGIWLRPEPVFVGFAEDATIEFLQKANG
jgi:UDP-N-acetylmuramate dehydrogenase